MHKKGLGKGLGAIISTSSAPVEEMEKAIITHDAGRVIEIELEHIQPNPDQPRTRFDETEIQGLADSIQAVGLIQPIIVRKSSAGYFIVAGERRYRASKSIGLKKIRAIVIEADDEKNFSIALIENVQRQNLDPVEEAKAYRLLINRFKLKQQDVASKVGKDRSTITNALRILTLPEKIQEAISNGEISVGHAKVLLSVTTGSRLMQLYREIVDNGISVRALEKLAAEDEAGKEQSAVKKKQSKNAHIRQMEEKLVSKLGTKVEIRHSGKTGKIEISYYSLEDFDRIIDLFK